MHLAPGTERTLWMQLVFAMLTLIFGVLALGVAPRPGRSVRLGAWYVVGAAFTLVGTLATLSGVMAFPAAIYRGSGYYRFFVRYMTVANDARGFAVFGLALVLMHMVAGRRPAPRPGEVAEGLALLLAIGSLVGVLEGEFEPVKQYGVMSLIGGATIVAFFAALYVALVRASLDWHLWAALAIYAVREAINSFVEVVRSLGFVANDWKPPSITILWIGALSVVAMIGCTMIRLGWTRGVEPPALLERLRG